MVIEATGKAVKGFCRLISGHTHTHKGSLNFFLTKYWKLDLNFIGVVNIKYFIFLSEPVF